MGVRGGVKKTIIALLTLGFLACARGATIPHATPEMVDRTIARAVEWLYSKQTKGHWETADKRDPTTKHSSPEGGQWGGRTAIATYALLAADQSPQDARIQEAVKFLRKAEMVGTYAIGLRA